MHGFRFSNQRRREPAQVSQRGWDGIAGASGLGSVWGRLVRMSETKLEWTPDHAKEWKIAPDGMSIKVVIRDDIQFRSGGRAQVRMGHTWEVRR